MERDQPLQERPGNLPKQRTIVNKLLLVSSVIQCIGLLVFLIYILGASQDCSVFITLSILLPSFFPDYDEKNGFTLQSSGEFGSIKVQNNSLEIRCDGFYLLRLKGYFSRTPNIDFHYRNNQRFYLFSNFSSYQYVSSVAVVYLRFEDSIYQRVVSPKVSSTDLAFSQGEISLIQLTNDNFCGK
uniref:TNF family profile domain-containing protein n=1 Tax=Vombatus ursinus TaxID=29139 RepID=A0A4X2K5L3_VOMUR